jgi:hypothetical protein
VVDTTRYKSVALKIPYYEALVLMGRVKHRGPGQQMMHLIEREASEKGIRIKNERITRRGKRDK